MAADHFVHHRQVGKAWGANLQAIRLVRTIAHHVNTKLTLGVLHRCIGFTFWHLKAFGKQLEVVNQRLHVRLHVFTGWRRNLVVFSDHGARVGTQPLHALLDQLIGLAHFSHAHQIAVIAVAGLTHWNVKVQLVVDLVGLLFAQVPRDARAAQHRAGKAHVQCTLRCHHANTHHTLLPNTVIGQQIFILIHTLGEAVGKVFNKVQQRALAVGVELFNALGIAHLAGFELGHGVRQIAIDTTWAEVSCVHAGA